MPIHQSIPHSCHVQGSLRRQPAKTCGGTGTGTGMPTGILAVRTSCSGITIRVSTQIRGSRPVQARALELDAVKPLPQVDLLPVNQNNFLRTVWTDDAGVGKGFQRLGSEFKPTAISFTPFEVGVPVTAQTQTFEIIDSATAFTENIVQSGKASFEGWGGNASKSYSASSFTSLREDSITASLRRSYVSQPLRFIRPSELKITDPTARLKNSVIRATDARVARGARRWGPLGFLFRRRELPETGGDEATPSVRLLADAYSLLAEQGPEEFHAQYGSHFVAGYTVGGVYDGFYRMQFTSSETKKKNENKVKIKFNKSSLEGESSFSFEKEVTENESLREIKAGFQATGWNKASSPSVVSNDLESLVASANNMEVDDGERLEAVLGSYTDIVDYRLALQEFIDNGGTTTRTDLDIEEEEFNIIAQALSQEFLAFDFYERLLNQELLQEATGAFKTEAQILQLAAARQKEKIREKFGTGDRDSVEENWRNLAAYIQYVQDNNISSPSTEVEGTAEGGSLTPEEQAAENGRLLANDVLCSAELEDLYNDFVDRQQVHYITQPSLVVRQVGDDGPPTVELRGYVNIVYEDNHIEVMPIKKRNLQFFSRHFLPIREYEAVLHPESPSKRPVEIRVCVYESDGQNALPEMAGTLRIFLDREDILTYVDQPAYEFASRDLSGYDEGDVIGFIPNEDFFDNEGFITVDKVTIADFIGVVAGTYKFEFSFDVTSVMDVQSKADSVSGTQSVSEGGVSDATAGEDSIAVADRDDVPPAVVSTELNGFAPSSAANVASSD